LQASYNDLDWVLSSFWFSRCGLLHVLRAL